MKYVFVYLYASLKTMVGIVLAFILLIAGYGICEDKYKKESNNNQELKKWTRYSEYYKKRDNGMEQRWGLI